MLELCALHLLPDHMKRLRQLALEKEVDLNCINSISQSPLLLLCKFNISDNLNVCLEILLERNSIDVNNQDRDCWNALLAACYFYENQHLVKIVLLLLQRGININALNAHGCNPLHNLICVNSWNSPNLIEVVTALLDGGINVDEKMKNGSNALFGWIAQNHRHPDFFSIAHLLIERGVGLIDVNCEDEDEKEICHRNSLLRLCEQQNGTELLKRLKINLD